MIPPRVLIVAGSDSGGGAGLQADIKTCEANGAFACNAVTAVTAQNTRGVHGIVGIDAEFVVAQMDAVLGDIGADAIKTGMLATTAVIRAVATRARSASAAVVVDPVMVAAGGDVLIDADAIDAVRHELLPLATIATPNRREAAVLLGAADPPRTLAELRAAAADVHGRFRPHSVLVKGGDLADATALTNAVRLDRGPPLVVDVFYDGTVFAEFVSSKLDTRNTHGTGCTLASAIAARLAAGDPLLDAVKAAKTYLDAALRASACVHLGDGGYGPFVHAPAFWSARERVETSAGT
ncbi:hypothetical protein CTAYLR_007900 [Chrysophaeum taylorii]|uniref:Pyridoxamine kinase/Phosphomethylpyrimidine kinase domain-containing protein n=1 Tax=Chrysophaeum taylorii TaxID=2483200 RepID=A0AAD7UMW8_9STRA|nr:hypothetical protein CTAYLR_007900 [Chrysophaeum taylorii]